VIAISAGHYPEKPGACYPPDNDSWCEHDLAEHWINRITPIIRQQVMVEIVPSGWLGSKVRYINALPACKLAVELHFNSAPGYKGAGCETLYCPGSMRGRHAAEVMQEHLAKVFPPDRGAKEGWYRMDRPGHVDYKGDIEGDEKIDYFLAKTTPVALIVEPEFIFNRQLLHDQETAGCACLAEGILAAYDLL